MLPSPLPRRRLSLAVVLAAAALTAAAAPPPPRPAARPAPFLVGGVQVHERDHARWTETLRRTGFNAVAVTVYATQGDWDGDQLWFAADEPSVVDEIRTAKASGLAVVLILRVALDHAYPRNRHLWHGMIMPSSAARLDSWFAKYGAFVARWAAVAEREGVDVLGVGSELKALSATLPIGRWGSLKNYYGFTWYQRRERRRARRFADEIEARHLLVRGAGDPATLGAFLDDRWRRNAAWARQVYLRREPARQRKLNDRRRRLDRHWRHLIARTREVYGGRLTYAANFDNYRNVGFWPALDLIGINSYFSLRPSATAVPAAAERAQFRRSWEGILDGIESFQQAQGVAGMPYLFTEIGYTFRRHSTVEPWNHEGFAVVGWGPRRRRLVVWREQTVDYEERRRAFEALAEVHRQRRSGLAGILYWKLSTDPGHAAIEPFVLHVGQGSEDPLQGALVDFVAPPAGAAPEQPGAAPAAAEAGAGGRRDPG